jgi:hypothetical protein
MQWPVLVLLRWGIQAARAYMIVVDNRRIWTPDAELALHARSQVEFIKILPLVGG